MSCETIAQLTLSFLTACAAIFSLIISVKTLKQNSRMIEASTRPLIKPYLSVSYVRQPTYYLILKNFGNSSAKITKFECDFDLSTITYPEFDAPFANIIGAEFPPSHKIFSQLVRLELEKITLDYFRTHKKPFAINIFVEYISDSNAIYSENTDINIGHISGVLHSRPHPNNSETSLRNIADGIIDLGEKFL